jgi:hypothetical protein
LYLSITKWFAANVPWPSWLDGMMWAPLRLSFPITSLLAVALLSSAVLHGQQPQLCTEWNECRQMALDAAARGQYELFHDLAWRTVQRGPKNDPALMFLLARAQVLSGRPHDALVMLERLAGRGVAEAAITDPDFQRTRELPGWPAIEALLAARVDVAPPPPGAPIKPPTPITPAKSTTPISAATAPKPESSAANAPVSATPSVLTIPVEPAPASDATHFSTERFRPAGLAFDAVSQRFVIGDALARKLIVVGVGAGHADDMVRAESAGFDDVAALSIDVQRGDLWVASTAETSGTSSLHRLQLVSGRPLKTYRIPESLGPARVIDLAVQASGGVVALDAAGHRLLTLPRGAGEVVAALRLDLSGEQSIANDGSENIVFIAHDGGIARVDVKARTVAPLTGPKGLDLSGFESIRTHRDSIVGLRTSSEGQRQLVRLTLNGAGRAVREAAVIDQQFAEGRVALNITGDELYYLAIAAPADTATAPGGRTAAEPFVIRHLTLR